MSSACAGSRPNGVVDPWGLVDKDAWYLVAGTERAERTFRVDRIAAAEPTEQPAERPDDFVLAAAWERVVGEVEEARLHTWATVLIEPRFVPILRDHFGRPGPGPLGGADALGHRPRWWRF